MKEIARMSSEQGARCMFHIRAAAGLKYDERRKPQDGRWVRHRQGGPSIDLRLNTMPTLHGESMAMRILIRDSKLLSLESLGLAHPQLGMLMSWLQSPSGLILVTGPTGAGKTTTLYACLQHLNDGRRKIHTIENPIEYAVDGLLQSQVDELNGPDYRQLLRAVLRQSPDVVMIGEVRDAMAAETAVRGQQRAIGVRHTACAGSRGGHPKHAWHGRPPSLSLQLAAGRYRPAAGAHAQSGNEVADRFESCAANLCRGTAMAGARPRQVVYAAAENAGADEGYQGRCGIYELLNMSSALADLISAGRPSSEISRKAIEAGMLDFRRASLIQVAQGATSFDEILRVVPTADQWIGR